MPHVSPPRLFRDVLSWQVITLLLLLGFGFRVSFLGERVFWVDEVATATRVAGYTRMEIMHELADGQGRSPQELLQYQQLSADRPLSATLNALAHSPEHAPLYFLATRFWMQGFGSSVTAIRSFSVLLGMLVLPAIYGLSRWLLAPWDAAWLSLGLVALSPYFIAYAQEARPYSLWALTLVLGLAALVRALPQEAPNAWVIYGLTVALNLYTSLLSLPVLLGQGVYVWVLSRGRITPTLRRFALAAGLGMLLFLPWGVVIVQHWSALESNTTWTRSPLPWPVMVAIWLYSFAILVFDVPIAPFPGAIALGQGLMAAFVLGVMAWAVLALVRRTELACWGLILALALPTPLLLVLLDGIRGGQVSATSRYLFPAQIGLVLALAWGLADCGSRHPRVARRLGVALIGLCLLSNLLGLGRSPNYQKGRNIHNPDIAAVVNRASTALLLAEPEQTFDLLSLSHHLADSVEIRILPQERWRLALPSCATVETVFWFNPSPGLRQQAIAHLPAPAQLREAYQPTLLTPQDSHLSLWRAEGLRPCSP